MVWVKLPMTVRQSWLGYVRSYLITPSTDTVPIETSPPIPVPVSVEDEVDGTRININEERTLPGSVIPQPVPERMRREVTKPNPTMVDGRRFRSVGEELCCEIFEAYIGRYVHTSYRPNFLKNPETGHNLEYDCYDAVGQIAIEYNGSQHYKYTPRFHENEQKFHDQVYRDRLKLDLSTQYEIVLIRVPYIIDTADPCPTELSGYKYNPRIKRDQRRTRIREYLHPILARYYNL